MDDAVLDELIPMHDPTAPPRVLHRQAALAQGYSRRAIEHRVATGHWRRVLPSVYLTVDTFTWPDRLDAALAFAGPLALLSGASALTDEYLRSVPRPSSVLVLVPPLSRRGRRAGSGSGARAGCPNGRYYPGHDVPRSPERWPILRWTGRASTTCVRSLQK